MSRRIILSLALLVGLSCAAQAQDEGVEENRRANAFVARELRLPLAEIEHARGRDYAMPHAIFFAIVAKMAKVPMSKVVDAQDEAIGWGELCARFGLDMAKVMMEYRRVVNLLIDSGVVIPPPSEREWDKLLKLKPKRGVEQ